MKPNASPDPPSLIARLLALVGGLAWLAVGLLLFAWGAPGSFAFLAIVALSDITWALLGSIGSRPLTRVVWGMTVVVANLACVVLLGYYLEIAAVFFLGPG